MKGQKGITLIALVITIIVMLILVAVTITMAINGRLFEKAGEAAQGTNGAVANEKALGEGTINVNGRTENDINNLVDYYVNKASY